MRRFLLPLALTLNACMPTTPTDTATRAAIANSTFPPMKTFGAPRPVRPAKSNNDLALDFVELSFNLESGRALPVFTRFETPISVRVTGAPPASLGSDLNKLLHRLRSEASIDIQQTASNKPANITIEAVSRADIRRALPHAACFVVPNITSIKEYRQAKRTSRTSWAEMRERKQLAISCPMTQAPKRYVTAFMKNWHKPLGP